MVRVACERDENGEAVNWLRSLGAPEDGFEPADDAAAEAGGEGGGPVRGAMLFSAAESAQATGVARISLPCRGRGGLEDARLLAGAGAAAGA